MADDPPKSQPNPAYRSIADTTGKRTVLPSPRKTRIVNPNTSNDTDAALEAILENAVEATPVDVTEARAYPVHTAGEAGQNLEDIPEAVALDEIPAAVTKEKAPPLSIHQTSTKVRRVKKLPEKRELAAADYQPPPETAQPVDKTKFVSWDEVQAGEFRAEPLERIPGEGRDRAPVPRPKFMDGELPRSVERGVKHPQPGLVRLTALLLLVSKLLMFVNAIALPIIAIVSPESFSSVFWLPLSFFVFGILFLLCARKCRCRVCSCHFFFQKRCFKHRLAHRLPLLGHVGSAALHVLLFRWMRCMFCGTAIRMRPAPEDEELGLTKK